MVRVQKGGRCPGGGKCCTLQRLVYRFGGVIFSHQRGGLTTAVTRTGRGGAVLIDC